MNFLNFKCFLWKCNLLMVQILHLWNMGCVVSIWIVTCYAYEIRKHECKPCIESRFKLIDHQYACVGVSENQCAGYSPGSALLCESSKINPSQTQAISPIHRVYTVINSGYFHVLSCPSICYHTCVLCVLTI